MNQQIHTELEAKTREVMAKRRKIESDVSFREIEAQGLQNLAAKIWQHVQNSPDLTAEEIEYWGELTRSYIHAANRINAETTVKVTLFGDVVKGLNAEILFHKRADEEGVSDLFEFDNEFDI